MSEQEPGAFKPNLGQPESESASAESEKHASKKLDTLMSEDFDNYAIRFVNVNEYQEMMKQGVATVKGGEVFIPRHDEQYADQSKFKDFLSYHGEAYRGTSPILNWIQTSENATLSRQPTHAMSAYLEMMNAWKFKARKDRESGLAITPKDSIKRWRAALEKKKESYSTSADFSIFEAAAEFPEKRDQLSEWETNLSEKLNEQDFDAINQNVDNVIRNEIELNERHDSKGHDGRNALIENLDISDSEKAEIRQLTDNIYDSRRNIASFGGEKNLEVVSNFLRDPSYFDKKENRRAVLNAIAYANQPDDSSKWRHYHVALVYSSEALSDESHVSKKWAHLSRSNAKSENLLGAVAIMPNKELWQNMAELSSQAGELAHPIFDSGGRVRYPEVDSSVEEN